MPRYFFSIEDHVRDEDHEGAELSGPVEARNQAIAFAAAVLRDDPDLVWDGREFIVSVTNEADEKVVDVIVRAQDGPAA